VHGKADVFRAEGAKVIRTPRANAYAERWVGAVRREVLDRMLILGRRQLVSVLAGYADRYNVHRPHRALGQSVAAQASRLSCRRAGQERRATGSARWVDP
jgi:hypothetical protein